GLRQLGIRGESPLNVRMEKIRAQKAAEGVVEGVPDTTEIEAENTVDGSRSTVYALTTALPARFHALEGLMMLNIATVLTAVRLPMRVASRRWGLPVAVR